MTISRRSAVGAISAFALAPAVLRAEPAAGRRPNIVLVIADDWGWSGAQCIDASNAVMPNFARMKREGVNFTNAFAPAPSCTASRGAVLSGQWPWRLREGANLQGSLPTDIPLYTELLESAGYYVGSMRKGWAPGSLEAAGRTQNPAGKSYASFDVFLDARPKDAAFCFWLGANDPHRPFEKGAGAASGIDLHSVDVPPYLPDSPEVRSDIADYRHGLERLDRDLGDLLARLERHGELDNTLLVLTGDNGWAFPRAKATLFHAGWHVPLTMMWKGKIQGNRESRSLVSLIDLAATFLDAAGMTPPPQMNSLSLMPVLRGARMSHRHFVLGATERHMDGRTQPGQGYPARALRTDKHLFIHNFRPDRWPAGDPERGAVDAARIEEDVWAAYADIDKGPTKAEIVTKPELRKYRELATGKRPQRMLFDPAHDPFDLQNLAGDHRHAKLVEKLEALLFTELEATGDPRVNDPGGDVFDSYLPNASGAFARPADWSRS